MKRERIYAEHDAGKKAHHERKRKGESHRKRRQLFPLTTRHVAKGERRCGECRTKGKNACEVREKSSKFSCRSLT